MTGARAAGGLAPAGAPREFEELAPRRPALRLLLLAPVDPAAVAGARRERGLTVEEVACLAGISVARARAAERSRAADPEDVAGVLEVLGVGVVPRAPADGRRRARGRVQVHGGALRAARRARGFTCDQVALRAGVAIADVEALEEGTGRPAGRALARVLDALGLPGQAPRFLVFGPP